MNLISPARNPAAARATSSHYAPPTPLQRRHFRWALAMLAVLVPLSPLLNALAISTQLTGVALPIAVLGLMHGAVDPWVGDRVLQNRFGCAARGPFNPVFIGAYLATMALVVICWIAAPLMTLGLFLAVSVLHFGAQDASLAGRRGDILAVVVLGAVPVLAPIIAHPDEVAVLFHWLVGLEPERTEPLLTWLLNPVIALWIVGAAMLISRMALMGEQGLGRILIIIGIVLPAMLLLPPLFAFAAYFCLLHSVGHVLELHAAGDGPWRNWRLSQWARRLWPATTGAIALGAAAWLLIPYLDPAAMPRREALARVLFCGLAALTAPHVLLHALASRVCRR